MSNAVCLSRLSKIGKPALLELLVCHLSFILRDARIMSLKYRQQMYTSCLLSEVLLGMLRAR
jgi:hypothetical protein